MRKVTMYYAFDDKEFDNYDECEEYESKAYELMRSIERKYSFYDKDMEEMVAPLNSLEVEDWLTWLDDAYSYCTYIRKTGSLTDDEAEIIKENIGSCIYNEDFSCAVGFFARDVRTDKWVKVDEQSTLIFCYF